MKRLKTSSYKLVLNTSIGLGVAGALTLAATGALADPPSDPCAGLPDRDAVRTALQAAVGEANGGLDHDMWATVVDRFGVVCSVVFSGNAVGVQWLGSRGISAQKANTAVLFSLPDGAGGVFNGLALSTANLYTAVQPGGTLFGLQESNPIDTNLANAGDASDFGTAADPFIGNRPGGVNVFGGGLALYNDDDDLVGGLGVSGDTSCADHNVAWRVRDALLLDNVPSGVGNPGDNIVYDIAPDADGHPVSAQGFGHPKCSDEARDIAQLFHMTHPNGSNE